MRRARSLSSSSRLSSSPRAAAQERTAAVPPGGAPDARPRIRAHGRERGAPEVPLPRERMGGEFLASNLSRGALVRLGRFTAVARDGRDGWTGRLVDFIADRFLDERPVKISYFHAPGLVSPFGMTFPELTPKERDAVRLVLKGLRTGDDVPRDIGAADGGAVSVSVTPLALRLQRFAAVETGTCLALSRDPRVAATLSRSCALDPRLAAATLDVRTDEFFSAWSAVLEKLFGVGPHLRVTFDWDKKNARFTPSAAALQLAKDHALGTAPFDAALPAPIPADPQLLAAAVLPDPGRLDAESAEAYFRTAREARGGRLRPRRARLPACARRRRARAATAGGHVRTPRAARGRRRRDRRRPRRALQPARHVRGARLARVPGSRRPEPVQAALARVADACSAGGRRSARRPGIVRAFAGAPVLAAAFLNVGGFLSASLLWGWQREGPPAPKGRSPRPARELVDAMRLLERLPMLAFSGRAAGRRGHDGVEP